MCGMPDRDDGGLGWAGWEVRDDMSAVGLAYVVGIMLKVLGLPTTTNTLTALRDVLGPSHFGDNAGFPGPVDLEQSSF